MDTRTIETLRIFGGFTRHYLFKKSIRCVNRLAGGVTAERNIFPPLCLFVKTLPIYYAVASGNGNRYFTQKWHVQLANNPRSPKSQTSMQRYTSFRPPSYFVTIYLKGSLEPWRSVCLLFYFLVSSISMYFLFPPSKPKLIGDVLMNKAKRGNLVHRFFFTFESLTAYWCTESSCVSRRYAANRKKIFEINLEIIHAANSDRVAYWRRNTHLWI